MTLPASSGPQHTPLNTHTVSHAGGATQHLIFLNRKHLFSRWLIAGEPGTVIRISWMNFNLEQSPGCAYDYLAVYDNTTIPNTGGPGCNNVGTKSYYQAV